ncbi:unnamed protein product [Paramecium sonneborni]|uniref:Uncharacterized protein n=1 Tax=Paramecium sonneborni TaxID=65129 RepID=A0A8S1LAX3_9CILI|nr:unnamed protein product [Paramecium sonneborni]
MNQQFSVEYLRINPNRYRRLPSLNATGSQIFNLSQEMITSRTKKNFLKPKLQALSHKKDDSKNFYHHSTIYNVREFKELNKVQDQQENNLTKYTELQTKIMVADFKKKVDAFLSKNNYKINMVGSKITSSQHELESFQSTNNGEQLNKSLCSNKYTIRTEYKSMKATEILVISNNKVVSRQIISSELIQQRLLKQMEHFLKDERFNYDLKMQTMIDQYEDIVNRIRQQAYTIKLPQNYQIQMSDYNEFYYKKEEPQIPSLNDKLDLLADQIIQEIQQSRESTPQMQTQINEVQQEEFSPCIEEVIKTEPVCIKEEETPPKQDDLNNEQIRERKISQRKAKPKKKQQQIQQSQQKQNESTSEINNTKSQQSSQTELPDISSIQQFQPKPNKKEHKEKKNNQQNSQPIQIQQQKQVDIIPNQNQQVQVIQNQHIIQNNNKKQQNIDKHKGKVHSRKITGDTVTQRQVPVYLDIPKEQVLETLSEKSHDETQQLEEIQIKKQESPKQEQKIQQIEIQEKEEIQKVQEVENQQIDTIQNQQIIKPTINKQSHYPEQRDAIDIWDNTKTTIQKSNPKPKPIQQENNKIVQIQQHNNNSNSQYIESIDLNQRKPSLSQEQIQQEILDENTSDQNALLNDIEPKEIKEESKIKQLQQENQIIIKNSAKQQIVITNPIQLNQEMVSQKIKEDEDLSKIDYQQIINEKMKIIEQKLKQPCLDIIDILLASDLVYNVNIDKFKISKSYKKKVNHPAFIFQQKDEEEVFALQVIWRHELQEVIPKLQNLNKQMEVLIDENDDFEVDSFNNNEKSNIETDN